MNAQIEQAIQDANGKLKQRKVTADDGRLMESMIAQYQDDQKVHTIRIYSSQGFVPNSYKWACKIAVIEAHRQEDGTFRVGGGQVDAKRSHGQGSLITVNGRPVPL